MCISTPKIIRSKCYKQTDEPMKWINEDIRLEGATVDILPLTEAHFPTLLKLAEEKRIWEFYPTDCSDRNVLSDALKTAMELKEKGEQYPFVILHKPTDTIRGSTRLMDMHPAHRKLEIGWTWLHPAYWATHINPECKLLLLRFCFEQLQTLRVQLKTDENNIRSRTAIAKIGAKFEGIFRHDILRANGTHRNSAYFSIINTEWKEAEARIETLINSRK